MKTYWIPGAALLSELTFMCHDNFFKGDVLLSFYQSIVFNHLSYFQGHGGLTLPADIGQAVGDTLERLPLLHRANVHFKVLFLL